MTLDHADRLARPGAAQRLDFVTGSGEGAVGPSVVRIREDNPGRFTGPGTNTFLVGDDSLWIIDPGEDRDDGHREAIERAVGGRPVRGFLLTHWHQDHWPLGARLAGEWSVPLLAFSAPPPELQTGPWASPSTGRLLDGCSVAGDDFRLTCLHTPGHCSDHASFILDPSLGGENRAPAIFCGDHVMAWSTTIIAPPDGSLDDYLTSLDLLLAHEPRLLLSAHGAAIEDPRSRITELRDHRWARTQQLVEALAEGPATVKSLVATIYRDTDPALHLAAAASLSAHVDSLIAAGRLERLGGGEEGLLALVE